MATQMLLALLSVLGKSAMLRLDGYLASYGAQVWPRFNCRLSILGGYETLTTIEHGVTTSLQSIALEPALIDSVTSRAIHLRTERS
jgi:hypothetical protein